jgi:hypothetical protein
VRPHVHCRHSCDTACNRRSGVWSHYFPVTHCSFHCAPLDERYPLFVLYLGRFDSDHDGRHADLAILRVTCPRSGAPPRHAPDPATSPRPLSGPATDECRLLPVVFAVRTSWRCSSTSASGSSSGNIWRRRGLLAILGVMVRVLVVGVFVLGIASMPDVMAASLLAGARDANRPPAPVPACHGRRVLAGRGPAKGPVPGSRWPHGGAWRIRLRSWRVTVIDGPVALHGPRSVHHRSEQPDARPGIA